MKKILFLLIVLLSTLKNYSQTPDLWQGDSIYRVNNIRTRTTFFNWDNTNWRVVDHYNRLGQLYEHVQYDTSGLRCVSRTKAGFDSVTHLMNSQVVYDYGRFDTATKKMIFFTTPDTLVAKFEYDSLKRVIRKSYVRSTGKMASAFSFSYEPFVVIEKIYNDNGSWNELTIYHDEHFKEKTAIMVYHPANADSAVITYTFRNTYDKHGNLMKRSIRSEPESDNIRFAKSQEYKYMSSGLLIRKTSYLKNMPGYVIMELFDYKFW